ncbi:MAG: STAS/SEC14 domain-containing protein [Bacteroidales bacterium]|nr:STAS/SEC14 domain-containing protein [Bacteroidales bacterium]
MPEVFYNTEILTLNYVKEEKLVIIEWKKNATTKEYRNFITSIIEFSKKNKVLYLMSDMRKEGVVNTEDIRWLKSEITSIADELNEVKVALIVADNQYSNIYAETLKRKFKESPLQFNIFKDRVSAKSWLIASSG